MNLFTSKASFSPVLRKGKRKSSTNALFAQPQQRDLWSEHQENEREMALLFLDIRDFTHLTGTVQAVDVVHLMRKLISVFQRIIRNYHGRIIETTGDGFYAAFGFDMPVEKAANEAMNASRAILRYLEIMNTASFERNLHRKIEVGIGIHTGIVAIGHVNLEGIDRLLVMGHAVNIASRLQAATKVLDNNVVISAAAFKLLNIVPEDTLSANVRLKGIHDFFPVRLMGRPYSRPVVDIG